MADDFKDFAEFIWGNYRGKKVIEVGVGPDARVFRDLFGRGMDITATDIAPSEGVVVDDITKPDFKIYASADLIYSIRPNPEIYQYLRRLASRVGADLIIKPMSTDALSGGKLVSYKKANFYLFKKGCAR